MLICGACAKHLDSLTLTLVSRYREQPSTSNLLTFQPEADSCVKLSLGFGSLSAPQDLVPMLNCPRCHQSINSQVITCPHCGTVLKAYGHPGITLHRATGDTSLCDTCTYHADDTCNFPQRPHARECTLYDDMNQRQLEKAQLYASHPDLLKSIRFWCQRNIGLLSLLGLVAVSIFLALMASSR